MKPPRIPRILAAVLVLGWPGRTRALFGVGDVVFDPANVAQTINVLQETRRQFDRLGSILGVSTGQLDQLVNLSAAIGNASESGIFGRAPSPAELEAAVRAVPGLGEADLRALFDTNGLLDAFLGVPLGQWTLAFENPGSFYTDILTNPAIARVGASAGLASPSVSYAQWYAALGPRDRANLGGRAASDIANLLAADWLNGARQRRINLQALAAGAKAAETGASGAQTLADQQHAAARIAAAANAVLVESAVQAAGAQEAAVRTAGAQGRLLQEENDARRAAAELQLDMPP